MLYRESYYFVICSEVSVLVGLSVDDVYRLYGLYCLYIYKSLLGVGELSLHLHRPWFIRNGLVFFIPYFGWLWMSYMSYRYFRYNKFREMREFREYHCLGNRLYSRGR